jgi:glycosyltransferase involved in cell wall biosynthesis
VLPKRPVVSVVIPHLNQPEALEICLTSLDAQTLNRDLFEVIVVDNGSQLFPKVIAGRHSNVKLALELSPGPGNARNRGVSKALGDVLAFIDADCRAHPRWLQNALQALESTPPRTILGGDVQIWRDNQTTYSALEAYESVFAYRFKMYIEQRGFSGTGNLIIRRNEFDSVGRFKGIEFAEDIDWGHRALAAGFKFRFEPNVVVYHPARQSFRELCVKWDRHIQHALNSARGKPLWRLRWFARSLAILGSSILDWTQIVASDRVCGVRARLKACFVLVAVRTYRAWKMVVALHSPTEVAWNRETRQSEPYSHLDSS